MAEGGHEMTPTGKIKNHPLKRFDWVVTANSFLKTVISNILEGSEDDML
jgi:hypothetical protein